MIRNFFLAGLVSLIIGCVSQSFANATPLDIDAISGVYKQQFKNGTIDGTEYNSENILEVVRYSQDSVYLRMHLEFFNGHSCDFWGVAKKENNSLIYRSPTSAKNKCELKAKIFDAGIVFDDVGGNCRATRCGARGGLNASFPLIERKNIRYMDVLLKSKQYKESVDKYLSDPHVLDIKGAAR